MIAETEPFEGKYEILAKIREGGMGAIYKVRHRLLDEIRVIKVIRPHLSTSPEMGERFLREARLAIRVRHPNIAQLHDFSIDPDGTAYIVMEFIDGLTLADVLAAMAPLPLGLALEVAHGALCAIGYLHRRSLIHRDISPDNLMLGKDENGQPHVTLLDLGIAKSLAGSSALTSAGAFLGKPRYASPEHFGAEGLAGVGPYSDLYSFGVVLYELLTGVCPIQGRDTSSWIAGHLFRPPLGFAESDPQGRVPEELRAILLKTLAKVPNDRFASAEAMAGALEPLRSRFPIEPGALERALGALRAEAPLEAPLPPGTTQEAFDRRFSPIETPLPRSDNRASTLVLQTQEALSTPSASRAPSPAEATQVLPLSAATPRKPEPAPAVPPPRPPAPEIENARKPPYPALALAAVLLFVLSAGILWVVRPREAQEADQIVEKPVAPPAPLTPELVETAPVPAIPKSAAVTEPPSAAPQAPAESQAVEEPETRQAPKVRPPAAPRPPVQPPVEQRPSETTSVLAPAETEKPPGVGEGTTKSSQKPAPGVAAAADVVRDREPELIEAPVPPSPEIVRGTGLRAQIFVKVRVDEDGRIVEAQVEKAFAQRGPSGQDPTRAQALAFREAAVEAARQAVYKPGLRNGLPVRIWKQIVFDFRE